ncbi:MAG: CCA tRNA nucleotidyltransferase [Candidatus Margulisiibacteriota bacterium]|nr:CCA tRNA nucleotidyltransferase [Candidatus Margulisiibacteriota bacterium]
MRRKKFPKNAVKIIKTLKKNGYQAYLVGGCIRDMLLGLPVLEWDITTSAKPNKVKKLFKKVVPTGIKYGTVTIILDKEAYEVTTFRSDEKYIDGRHPKNVVFTGDIHQDLSRRDFTINAIAYDPIEDKLIDNFNGKKDLKKKIIRTVGNPVDRFSEDGLRSVRACRFAAKLQFKIEPKTFAAISKTLKITKKVAMERIHDEIVKLLAAKKPSTGFELMRRSGLLKLIVPELVKTYRVKQPPKFHKYDVYWHSLYSCDAAPAGDTILRMAALLHDIGKPGCKVGYTFYNHDKVGCQMTEKILKRLKFSSNAIKKIANLISHHMFNYTSDWSDAAVRRFIRRIGGAEMVGPLFTLRNADASAMEQEIGSNYLVQLKKRIKKILREENALHIKDLKVDGKDVMNTLKIKSGPKVGKVLNCLLEEVLDHPKINKRDDLLKMIKGYA